MILILPLNEIITLEKNVKLLFCAKNWRPDEVFYSCEKRNLKGKSLFLKKKSFQLIFADKIFKTVCEMFLKK